MKKIIATMLIAATFVVFTACSNSSDKGSQISPPPENISSSERPQSVEASTPPSSASLQESSEDAETDNILIAYFSRADENISVGYIEKGNTEIIAEMISEQTGGTLFHIETVNPYPKSYDECTAVAQQEKSDNARPELTGTVENMDEYDVIFLGYPIWWGDMPMAVYTFLESYGFTGKTIIPFCTHEGSGISDTEQSISDTCPGAELLDGLAIRGKTAQESREEANGTVFDWLRENGFAI